MCWLIILNFDFLILKVFNALYFVGATLLLSVKTVMATLLSVITHFVHEEHLQTLKKKEIVLDSKFVSDML